MAIIGVIGGLLGRYFTSHVRCYDFVHFAVLHWVNFMTTLLLCFIIFPGALFNQLTLYITSWRRKYLHKKGNRVKVCYIVNFYTEYCSLVIVSCFFTL